MVIDMTTQTQEFWSGLRMAVMNRQPGMTWEDIGRMPITYFFHVLRLSEKRTEEQDQRPGRPERKT